jgi:hypothetical protein
MASERSTRQPDRATALTMAPNSTKSHTGYAMFVAVSQNGLWALLAAASGSDTQARIDAAATPQMTPSRRVAMSEIRTRSRTISSSPTYASG